MRSTVTWVTFACSGSRPMGMQRYELEVLEALRAERAQDRWRFEILTVASVRHARRGEVRVPMRLLASDHAGAVSALGRVIYRHAEYVHRFDLRLPPSGRPEIVTVHDLPPLRFQDEGRLPGWAVHSARAARLVICPSQFAADEVAELTGVTRTTVVPNGVSSAFLNAGPARGPNPVDGPFVLHVGGATRRKNLVALAEAWKAVHREFPDLRLALIGPPDARRDEAFSGVDVVRLGYQNQHEIANAMQHAEVVVVPSIYEGFGLPALEAMSVGAPVVAARRGALPEVCGTAALLVEPDADGIAQGLCRMITDCGLRDDCRALGLKRAQAYSWKRSAAGHLEAYAQAFSS